MNNNTKGTLLILGSTTCFSIMAIMVKLAGESFSIAEQIFARNFVILIISLTYLLIKGKNPLGNRENRNRLMMRALSGTIGVAFYFYAIQNMFVANAVILQNTSPFFVTLLSAIFLKEKLTKTQIFVLFFAFFGAALVLRPKVDVPFFPSLVGLGSGCVAAISYLFVASLKGREDGFVVIFYFSLFSSLSALIVGFNSFVLPDLIGVIILLAVGVSGGAAQYLLTIAYSMASPNNISIYNYAGIIVSAVLGYLIFGEILDIYSIAGIIIIISAAIIIYLKQERTIRHYGGN